MTEPAGIAPASASEQFEWAVARFLVMTRAVVLTSVVINAKALSSQYRRPRAAMAGAVGAVAHGVWSSRRMWRNRHTRDRDAGRTEVPVGVMLFAAEKIAVGSSAGAGPRLGIDYAGFALGLGTVQLDTAADVAPHAVTILAATAVAAFENHRRGGPVHTTALGDLIVAAEGLAARPVVQRIREQARRVDVANAEAGRAAAKLAMAREHRRQQRLVHDSVLQTLEVLAGGWGVDSPTLLTRIELDIARLEALIADGGNPAESPLGQLVDDLVAEFAARDLAVAASLDPAVTEMTTNASRCIADIVRESLVNVSKHSGTDHAEITITAIEGWLHATIEDQGTGFDQGSATSGFGVANSIIGSAADAGGTAAVRSSPGAGTTVTVRIPQ